ncbi:MAG: phosphate acyltransferase PlsX [Firmicutes bacterium]|nr:phosphate acyltransferase PlsX [Bacillota bacterium]NBI61543.1 phosphate acyltransferase PlsX [Clostridiales bacterium]
MRVILDGMGGDNAPVEIVKGAVQAAKEMSHEIYIVGKEDKIQKELDKYQYDPQQVKVVHAEEVITNEDSPVKAIKRKKNSSMVVGLTMVKNGEGDIFISAGNTGAQVVGGRMILGRINGIDRPALASIYPILGDKACLLVDAGASAESKAHNLLEYGTMGSIYVEKVFGRPEPRVGLVNLGVEESKGTSVTKEAYKQLKQAPINFVGNVEARDIPAGACDVIVCDGFVGNVILKLTEGLAWNILKLLKKKFLDGLKAKIGAMFLKNKLGELKDEFDYTEYGGAPILGVDGAMVKMHGSSNANAVKNTILKGIPYAEEGVVDKIKAAITDLEEIIAGEQQ